MANYQGRIATLADKDNNAVVPVTNARAVEVSNNRKLEEIVEKVDELEITAQRVFNTSITPIITPIQTSIQRLDGIEGKVDTNTDKINKLEQKQISDKSELINSIDGVQQNIQTIEGNVTNINNTVTQHSQQIADVEHSVGEMLPKVEEAIGKVEGALKEKYVDCIAQGETTQAGLQADGQVATIDDSFAKKAVVKGESLTSIVISKTISLPSSATNYGSFEVSSYEKNKQYLYVINNVPKAMQMVYLGDANSQKTWTQGQDGYTTNFTQRGNIVVAKVTCPNNYDGSTIYPHFRWVGDSPSSILDMKFMLIPYQDGIENLNLTHFDGLTGMVNPIITTVKDNLLHQALPAEEANLRRLPTGVYDTLDLATGGYVQQVGERNFTENDSWTRGTAMFTPLNVVFSTNIDGNSSGLTKKNILDNRGFSNNVGSSANYQQFNGKKAIVIRDDGKIYFSIPKKDLESDDIEGWKKFLIKNGGIKVYYELITPINKKIRMAKTPFIFKGGHVKLSSSSGIMPSTPLEYTATLGITGQVETLGGALREVQIEKGEIAPVPNSPIKRDGNGNVYVKDRFMFEDGKTIRVNGERIQWGNTADWHNIHDTQTLPVERGTWTPSFEGALGGVCVNYVERLGIYQRVDKLVHIQMKIVVNDYNVCQGIFCIGGLPFRPGNTHTALSIGVINNLKTTLDNTSINSYIDANSDKIIIGFNEVRDGTVHYQFQNTQVANPSQPILLIIAGTYMID